MNALLIILGILAYLFVGYFATRVIFFHLTSFRHGLDTVQVKGADIIPFALICLFWIPLGACLCINWVVDKFGDFAEEFFRADKVWFSITFKKK